jgi:DNA-binding NarL/FixJ family response regulator
MSIRAVVLDDDPSWLGILDEILTEAGFEVEIAGNLQDALQIIIEKSHRLAVVDLSLSQSNPLNLDGLAFIKALRDHDPGCVAILLTGFATVEIAVRAITDFGVYTCIRKEMFQRQAFKMILSQAISISVNRNAPVSVSENGRLPDFPKEMEDAESAQALLVDDDAGWREILQELLLEAGYFATTCTGFGEALGWLRRKTYRLIVVDLALGGLLPSYSAQSENSVHDLIGFHLLESINTAQTTVIVVSGAANLNEIERAYRDFEVFAFVEKQTFDRQTFLRILADVNRTLKDASIFDRLTEREKEVLDLLSKGLTNKEIAKILVITPNTVKRHLKAIFSKLNIHTRSAAASLAVGWLGAGRNFE